MSAVDLQKVKADFENSPFWSYIGLQLKDLKEGYVLLAMPIQNDFINVRNTLHGGVYASVLDTAMGMTARTLGYEEVVTLNLNIQYLKSVVDGTVFSDACIINRSRNTVFIEGKLMNEEGDLLAHCTGTFKVS